MAAQMSLASGQIWLLSFLQNARRKYAIGLTTIIMAYGQVATLVQHWLHQNKKKVISEQN